MIVTLLLSLLVQSMPGTTAQAKRQAERVMNSGLPFAEKRLAEEREFVPFGAVMLPEGLIQVVGTEEPLEARPLQEVYTELSRGLREGAGSGAYLAVATFVLVELRHPESGETINAVHVALEHQAGYCADVYYPSILRDDTLVLGEAFAGKRSGTFFDNCN